MKYRVKSRFRFTAFVVMAIIMTTAFGNWLLGTNLEVAAGAAPSYTTVEIAAGDSLWTIARDYMPDDMDIRDAVWQLREVNGLSSTDVIKAGDKLVVPTV